LLFHIAWNLSIDLISAFSKIFGNVDFITSSKSLDESLLEAIGTNEIAT
jgi:hypothetical protein